MRILLGVLEFLMWWTVASVPFAILVGRAMAFGLGDPREEDDAVFIPTPPPRAYGDPIR